MIRHIVLFSAQPGADFAAIREGLRLLERVPHSLFFEIGDNLKIDRIGNVMDFVVYGEFADEAALAAFKAHPLYAEATRLVRPLRDLRLAADFVSAQSAQAARSPGGRSGQGR